MRMKRLASAALATTALVGVVAGASPAEANGGRDRAARLFEVTVEVTNLAPENGTSQTPVWVGVQDGSFDLYDRNEPISAELERLAEDGSVGPIVSAFAASGAGKDSIVGAAPIAPGASASVTFVVDAERGQEQYFSYASMVLPSNDAFIANGNPKAHQLFTRGGQFRPTTFVVRGNEVLDAGSEVNDEAPDTTAFFGQSMPDTGQVEGGVVTLHQGFNDPATGGILASPDFENADFTAPGYRTLRFKISATRLSSQANERLRGSSEVPAISTAAQGRTALVYEEDGDIDWLINARKIDKVRFAHIHLGAPGENGPVVATLFDGDLSENNRLRVRGEISDADLVGPFAGMTTLDLWQAIRDGNAYVNVHTDDFPGGELRANLP